METGEGLEREEGSMDGGGKGGYGVWDSDERKRGGQMAVWSEDIRE